jgi:purine-binding chemotaxis protein CheW
MKNLSSGPLWESEFQNVTFPKKSPERLLVFALDDQRYGLCLSSVKRIIRIPEITPLPKVPQIVLGAVNVQGEIIPVMNIRKRFCLPQRDLDLSDHLIIACTSHRNVALAVDAAIGVIECREAGVIAADRICPGLSYVEGAVKLDDGLILIHDLETFLSLEEHRALEQAIAQP